MGLRLARHARTKGEELQSASGESRRIDQTETPLLESQKVDPRVGLGLAWLGARCWSVVGVKKISSQPCGARLRLLRSPFAWVWSFLIKVIKL